MISIKYAILIAIGAFAAGSFFASPLPEAIAAVIANDVQCTGCVGTPDLAGNAVTSVKIKDGEVKTADLGGNVVTTAKIKDGEVKAADIAADAVGASELQGVTKLIFNECHHTSSETVASGEGTIVFCQVNGVDNDDSAVASLTASTCFDVAAVLPTTNQVYVVLENECGSSATLKTTDRVSIIVFDSLNIS